MGTKQNKKDDRVFSHGVEKHECSPWAEKHLATFSSKMYFETMKPFSNVFLVKDIAQFFSRCVEYVLLDFS